MLWFSVAWGLSCSTGWDINVLPHPGSVLAPPNVVVHFAERGGGRQEMPVLYALDGDEVPTELVVEPHHLELWPLEPLAEGTYEIPWGGIFDVGGPADETPPPEPEFIEVWKRKRHGGKWTYLEFVEQPTEHHFEIQASEDETFAADVLTVLGMVGPTSTLGSTGCGVMPGGYDHSAKYHLRARTVDLAGNTSDWVHHEPARARCGCSSSPAGLGGFGTMLGLALLQISRRRHGRPRWLSLEPSAPPSPK